jgi:hypothetical protein
MLGDLLAVPQDAFGNVRKWPFRSFVSWTKRLSYRVVTGPISARPIGRLPRLLSGSDDLPFNTPFVCDSHPHTFSPTEFRVIRNHLGAHTIRIDFDKTASLNISAGDCKPTPSGEDTLTFLGEDLG